MCSITVIMVKLTHIPASNIRSKSTTDFAGFVKTDLPDEYYQEAEPHIPEGKNEGDLKSAAHTEYGLRYGEFISPLIKAVQELSAKVAALEAA